MADATIRVLNERHVAETIQQLVDYLGSKTGYPQKVIGLEIVRGIQHSFITQTSPWGTPWRPPKSRKGKALRDKGTLFNSFAVLILGSKVFVGTNDPRARLLNFGGTVRAKKGKLLAIPVNKKGQAVGGAPTNFRAQYPDAFVLNLGGKDYGYDRLWLVRRIARKKSARGPADSAGYSHNVSGRGTLQFLALLVKEINVPGRGFMGVSPKTEAVIVHRLHELAARAWERRNARR